MAPQPETIQELVHRITAVTQPRRVLLFGSAARGEMRPDSDLDVLVVVGEGEDRRAVAQRIHVNLIGFSHAVDVVVATEADIATYGGNPSMVLAPAGRDGKLIYAA